VCTVKSTVCFIDFCLNKNCKKCRVYPFKTGELLFSEKKHIAMENIISGTFVLLLEETLLTTEQEL
jgi:hypothetical protein